MKDYLHTLLEKTSKLFDYERGKIFGILAGLGLVIWVLGCNPTCRSPISGNDITRSEWQTEVLQAHGNIEQERAALTKAVADFNIKVETHNKLVEAVDADFDIKEARLQQILNTIGGVAVSAANGDPISVGSTLMTLLTAIGIGGTVGGIYDAKRKNEVIQTFKNSASA